MLKKILALTKKRGITFDLFFTHILVLIIPIVLNIAIEGIVISQISSETENTGLLIAENARNNMDYIIDNVERTVKQINSNETIHPIYQDKTEKDIYSLRESVNTLNYTCQNTDDIEDIFIYNDDSDIVVTKLGCSTTDSFVNKYYSDTNIDYTAWKDGMKNLRNSIFRVIYKKDSPYVAYLEYICPLTGNSLESYNHANANFPAIITVRMNMNKLSLTNVVKTNYPGVSVCVVNSNGEVICDGDTSKYDGEYILSKCAGEDFSTFKKDGMMYICKKSNKNDWVYVSSTSIWKYNIKSIVAIITVIAGAILVFLLSLKIILHFVRTNYGGIINLSNRIIDEFKMKENIRVDDINKCFDLIMDERNVLSDDIKYMREVQNSAYILKLLNGISSLGDGEEFKKIKEQLESEWFSVVCCKIESCVGLYTDTVYEKMDSEEKQEDAYFIVRNVLSELFESKCAVISVPFNDKIVFLVGNKKVNEAVFKKTILSILESFTEISAKQFKIECVASVGNMVDCHKDISKSYYKALEGMPYSFLHENNRVVNAEEYSKRDDKYKITPQHRQQLSVNLQSGNASGAIEVLNDLYDINTVQRKLSIEMVKCFLMELSGIYEEQYVLDKEIQGENIVLEVFKLHRISQTKEFFEKLTLEICECINSNKGDKLEKLAERIKQYIDNYYTDENINVFAVSNALGLSRAYVSKIFKQYTGESILDCIHKKRIEYSIILLKEGKSVNDIAEMVGYVNSSVFIKTFKKYKGVAPKQYIEADSRIN